MKIRLSKKSGQNIKKIIAISIILLFFIAFLNFTNFSKNIRNFFFLASAPVQELFWQAGRNVSGFFSGFSDARMLKKELENLKIENQELISQIIFLKELEKENEYLRSVLDLESEKDFQIKLARVISKDVFQDSILINKGEKDGISEGWPVVTGQKVLLGKIGQVYDNFSEVILISNKKSSFDAKIVEKEIYGIMKGKGNFKVSFDLIPKDKEIFENEMVVTSVLGGVYPPGLLVGKIEKIERPDPEPFQKAEIETTFDLKKLNYLFIITEF